MTPEEKAVTLETAQKLMAAGILVESEKVRIYGLPTKPRRWSLLSKSVATEAGATPNRYETVPAPDTAELIDAIWDMGYNDIEIFFNKDGTVYGNAGANNETEQIVNIVVDDMPNVPDALAELLMKIQETTSGVDVENEAT